MRRLLDDPEAAAALAARGLSGCVSGIPARIELTSCCAVVEGLA